jgi:hypothetical protein
MAKNQKSAADSQNEQDDTVVYTLGHGLFVANNGNPIPKKTVTEYLNKIIQQLPEDPS